jgi:hypothetical protein
MLLWLPEPKWIKLCEVSRDILHVYIFFPLHIYIVINSVHLTVRVRLAYDLLLMALANGVASLLWSALPTCAP